MWSFVLWHRAFSGMDTLEEILSDEFSVLLPPQSWNIQGCW